MSPGGFEHVLGWKSSVTSGNPGPCGCVAVAECAVAQSHPVALYSPPPPLISQCSHVRFVICTDMFLSDLLNGCSLVIVSSVLFKQDAGSVS